MSASLFSVGDRVRLSKWKKAFSEIAVETGEVVRIPDPKGGLSVAVWFDGNTKPTRIHRSYIEVEGDVAPTVERKSKA